MKDMVVQWLASINVHNATDWLQVVSFAWIVAMFGTRNFRYLCAEKITHYKRGNVITLREEI